MQALFDEDKPGVSGEKRDTYFSRNININDGWLRLAVNFELIQLLKEYWFDEPEC